MGVFLILTAHAQQQQAVIHRPLSWRMCCGYKQLKRRDSERVSKNATDFEQPQLIH